MNRVGVEGGWGDVHPAAALCMQVLGNGIILVRELECQGFTVRLDGEVHELLHELRRHLTQPLVRFRRGSVVPDPHMQRLARPCLQDLDLTHVYQAGGEGGSHIRVTSKANSNAPVRSDSRLWSQEAAAK